MLLYDQAKQGESAMSSPDFNLRSKPYEHRGEVPDILEAFQDLRGVDNRYFKLGKTPTYPSYMRNISLAVTGANILSLMDRLENTLYNNYERPPEAIERSVTLMEDAINNSAYDRLSAMSPSSANTVQALSALHMAEIYAAWTEYHLTNVGLAETERAGIGAPDDLNTFREMALGYIREAATNLSRQSGQWEGKDLNTLIADIQRQLEASEPGHEAVHPVDKMIGYFSNIQGEPTPESLRFIHLLDQRRAAIFSNADGQEGQTVNPTVLET